MNIQRLPEDKPLDFKAISEVAKMPSVNIGRPQTERVSRDDAELSKLSHLMTDSTHKYNDENAIRQEKMDTFRGIAEKDLHISDDKILSIFSRMLNT